MKIFSNFGLGERYNFLVNVNRRWFWLVRRMLTNIKGLCLDDDFRLQVFLHKHPSDSLELVLNQSCEPYFFGANTPHRNVCEDIGEFCRSDVLNWPPSIPVPVRCMRSCSAAFCVFLIRNSAQHFENLHIAITKWDHLNTLQFLIIVLSHVFSCCKRLKSLQLGSAFLRLFSRISAKGNNIYYTDTLLDNVPGLEEFIIIKDDDGGFHPSVGQFLETLTLKCKRIRRLTIDDIELGDNVVYDHIAEMHLERFDLRLNEHRTYGPNLFSCLLSSFETLTELKLSVPLRLPHQIFFQNAMEYLRCMTLLEKFSIGYQLSDQACIHAGCVANALSEGFTNLKYLELCSLKFKELTNAAYSVKGRFLGNVARTLEYLHVGLSGDSADESLTTIPISDCCGDLTRAVHYDQPMINLRHLKIAGQTIVWQYAVVEFVVRLCPNLEFLDFLDYGRLVNFVGLARRIRDRIHNKKNCRHDKIESPCPRQLEMITLSSFTSDMPEQLTYFEQECGLEITQDDGSDTLCAYIDRCCTWHY